MQKGTSDLLTALDYTKRADLFFRSSMKEGGANTPGGKLAHSCQIKTAYIINQIATYSKFNDFMRNAINNEVKADAFTIEAIVEKLLKLSPDSREAIEGLLDTMLKGESITVQLHNIPNKESEAA